MIHHHIDALYLGRAMGWAFKDGDAAKPLVIEAWHRDVRLGGTIADRPREDVGVGYPKHVNSARSGFDLEFRVPSTDDETAEIVFRAFPLGDTGKAHDLSKARIRTLASAAISSPPASASPFPAGVTAAIRSLWPSDSGDLRDEVAQLEMADRILFIARGSAIAQLPPILEYVRFLRSTWAHFRFVSRYFPTFNSGVATNEKDANNKQNSPNEMLAIANHLFVLKSFGVPGDFAEFGCFKGFSSSMLSFACDQLAIPMHIFDSFEGLPPSDSHYYKAGDFRGEFDEVRKNIAAFGVERGVTYHKGYFADSLPKATLPNLMSLWMDVDLASSATDVMTIADRIDPRGAIFSHECEDANFLDGQITGDPHSVLPSIVAGFNKIGAQAKGRFLAGNTGAFWRKDGGLPVLAYPVLMKLVQST